MIADSRTVWGGPAGGIDGVHVWEFSPRDNGVLVRTRESWSREPVHANARALQSALDESPRVWLPSALAPMRLDTFLTDIPIMDAYFVSIGLSA